MQLEPLGASEAPVREVNGRATYVDAYPATDSVWVATPDRVEWFFVLHDESAPSEFAWRVALPEKMPVVRVEPSGGLVFASRGGAGFLRMPRPFAVDSAGARRDAQVTWAEGRLTVRLDTSGLSYPVLLDPAIEKLVWEQKLPASKPSPRRGIALAYDSFRNRTVLFGGCPTGGGVACLYSAGKLGDTWEWDGSTWAQRAPAVAPEPRSDYGLVYDSVRKVTVLAGGTGDSVFYSATWEWDGTTWAQRSSSAPPLVDGWNAVTALSFDSARGFTVAFVNGNTLEWNGTTWAQRTPSTSPPARGRYGMAYDSARGRTVLFGGVGNSTVYGDTWEWNGTDWALRTSIPSPSARYGTRLTYGAARARTILFGGGALADTWEWDGTSWTQASIATSSPSGRYDHGLARGAGGRFLFFGGTDHSGAVHGDTWEYHTRGGACTGGSQCDTGNCVDNVCCDQPTCAGTCAACDQAAAPGQCVQVSTGPDSDTCPSPKTCAGAGNCGLPQGSACTLGSECLSGVPCVDGYCCNGACGNACEGCNGAALGWTGAVNGTCATAPAGFAGEPTCSPYLCNGTKSFCASPCVNDNGCVVDYYCSSSSSGTCQPQKKQAASCTDCKSAGCRVCRGGTFCKDTFCCATACAGTCETCAAIPGTCTTVTGADDADSCSPTSTKTCDSAGACKLENGQSCTARTDCASTFCADSRCCNSACSGGCDVCNATAGTCTTMNWGSTGASPSCSPYVCGGAASCPTACTSDTHCASGFYCDAAGTCRQRKLAGASCDDAAGKDCKTSGCRVCSTGAGTCSDGVCCNTACAGGCDVCTRALGATADGTCTVLSSGMPGSPSCAPLVCAGTAYCPTSCTADTLCTSTSYCAADGTCRAKKLKGVGCNLTAGADCKVPGCAACATGACVDGVCCAKSACGACETCNPSATSGDCAAVPAGADDPDTCSPVGVATCDGNGQCKTRQGKRCTVASQCLSGFCSDGACCDIACGGACDVCTQALGAPADGQCTTASATYPGAPSCTPFRCTGASTSCPQSCPTDASCVAGTYCASDGSCRPIKSQGASCDASAGADCNVAGCRVCSTGFCVDGVCCDRACEKQCDVCSRALGSSADGSCRTAPHGYAGSPSCGFYACTGSSADCAGTSCSSDVSCGPGYYCTVSGTCAVQKTRGSACSYATDCKLGSCRVCATGNCIDDVCCDTPCDKACDVCASSLGATANGTCSPAKKGSLGTPSPGCAPFLCDGASAACPTSCASETDCSAGNICISDRCGKKLSQGSPCTSSTQCVSGFCADGFCCDKSCGKLCEACSAAKKGSGTDGECEPVVTGTDPDSECPNDGAPSCQRDGFCSGTGACRLYPGGTACGAGQCSGNTIRVRTCSAGSCTLEPAGQECAPYSCSAGACTSPCVGDNQCVAGYGCDLGACKPKSSEDGGASSGSDAGSNAGPPPDGGTGAGSDAGDSSGELPPTSHYGCTGCSSGAGGPAFFFPAFLFLLAAAHGRRRATALCAALALALPGVAFAGPVTKKPKLAFLGVSATSGVAPDVAEGVSEFMQSELLALGPYDVIGQSEIKALIGVDRQKRLLGCGDESCLAELAGALSTDRTLGGNLSRIGDSVMMNLFLLGKTGTPLNRVGRRVKVGQTIEPLLDVVRPSLRDLVSKDTRAVVVVTEPPAERGFGGVRVGARADVDVASVDLARGAGLAGGLAIELGGRWLGLAGALLVPPLGLRIEGRFYPLEAGALRPFLAVGGTALIPSFAARAAAGLQFRAGPIEIHGDVAFERFLGEDPRFRPNAILVGAGLALPL